MGQLIADCGRRSPWSPRSSPVRYHVPVSLNSKAPEATLAVQAVSVSSVTFRWPELLMSHPPSSPKRGIGNAQKAYLPDLEFRLDVFSCASDGSKVPHTSLLIGEDEEDEDGDMKHATRRHLPTEASAFGLRAGAEYKAELSVRLARMGARTWQPTGLSASFVMPAAEEQPQRNASTAN